MSAAGDFRGLPAPARAAAEIALNRYIGADAIALERAAALSGRALTVCFTDLGLAVTFIGERHGLQVAGDPEGEPDVRLTGRAAVFARVFFSGGRDGLTGGGLRIAGDIGIAQQFADLFAGVDFDLGDLLDQRFGPVVGHFLERGAKGAAGLFSRLRRELPSQAAEYLREETRDVIGAWEHEQLAGEVEAFRDRVERSAARIKRLERRR
ncbi:ubiquinone biosynthesis accessory factor UbiJ [Salinisphaera sp.]|uniref:ubiquinone biosynthesis accessory factor UbiJ n=1 Tax=Salinisphaera sp. TaxID=1914330 RepID=UPI002D78BDAE|nr:SCP2 sterol-binding domain-containing protein [Salinisphaera sp.]HET7315464.1 SCP2 sterol-binding domain-containing protein [Salinisphaera sp.]